MATNPIWSYGEPKLITDNPDIYTARSLNFEILDTYQTWAVNKTFTAAVTDIITSATHGLVDNDEIRVYSGNTLPAPLYGETVYFVKRIDANTFYLALTAGGATINITTTGVGTHRFYRSIEYRKFTVDTGTNIFTSNTHGFSEGDMVKVVSNSELPSPLVDTPTAIYYIKYIDANTFYLSLTSGGDAIDITTVGTGTHWVEYLIGYKHIKNGALITNTTRAGSAMMILVDRLTFSMGDVNQVQFLVISGSFLAQDVCTTAHGGSFVLQGTVTTVTDDTIVVDGIDDSDSTADLMGAINASQITIYNSSYAVLPSLRYIKIDSEWMYIIRSGDNANSKTFTAAVTDICTSAGHGLVNGQVVRLTTTGTLPAGLALATGYYVKYINANTFYLSLTLDGANVDITDTGAGTHTFTLQDSLTVKRAMFGTTAATHADNASMYILAEDLPRAIIDEDVAQGWGLTTMANGKFEINAPLVLGRPDQTAQSIFLTVLDRIQCDSLRWFGGITYDTIFQSGVGWVDSGEGVFQGLYFNGSNISYSAGYSYEGTTLNIYGGTLYLSDVSGDTVFSGACNFMTMSLSSLLYSSFVSFSNRQACKIYRSWVNNQRLSASSTELDWDGVYINFKISQETYYFLLSGGDATFRNMEMVDSTYDAGGFAFAAGGIKTFIDCTVNVVFGQFLAGVQCIHKKSLGMSTTTESGIDVPNVNIKLWDKNGLNVVDVDTDVVGVAETQEVLFYDSDVGVDLNPFKVVVIKAGWKDKAFNYMIDAPKVLELTMTDAGLTEDEN